MEIALESFEYWIRPIKLFFLQILRDLKLL